MAEQTLAHTIELRIVYRFPYYFYNRIGGGEEVTLSVSAVEARRIYTAVCDAPRQVVEGTPRFDTSPDPWAWSAWVTVEEGDDGSQRP